MHGEEIAGEGCGHHRARVDRSILAHELCDAGLSVSAIERGPWRDPTAEFTPSVPQDELRFRIRHDLFLRQSQTSLTFRNNRDETALPVRTSGAFMLGNGVGGGELHWNAEIWRFLPSDFVLQSHLTQRYGAKLLPEDMTIQDWGITYDDLEPHYDRFEYLCGTSGTAGNIKGQIHDGGNPQGPRSRPYPTPAQKPAEARSGAISPIRRCPALTSIPVATMRATAETAPSLRTICQFKQRSAWPDCV